MYKNTSANAPRNILIEKIRGSHQEDITSDLEHALAAEGFQFSGGPHVDVSVVFGVTVDH